jgi:hypothetical protein
MLDYRIHYAQLAAEDRIREARQHAAIGRQSKRIFQLNQRRTDRQNGR